MDRVPVLVVMEGTQRGARFSVTPVGLILGRDEDCDVPISDPGVSRQHARVLLHNAGVWVRDEGSRNGVFINGKRVVRPKQMAPGDELVVGDHRFTIEVPGWSADESSVNMMSPMHESRQRPWIKIALGVSALLALVLVALLAYLGAASG